MSSGLFRVRDAQPQTYLGAEALFEGRSQGTTVLFHDDDPTSTVVVTQGIHRAIITNGKPDGNIHVDYTTMALMGLVPALFSDDPSRVFVIGWGLGVSVGELAMLTEVDRVTVAEISPGVLAAAPLFDASNQNASKNPKVEMLRSDAYRALLRSEGPFGVIVSEPSNPWVMGVEMLFSEEFLRVARDRLTPGGVYAQWFHLYEVNAEALEIVIRTYKAVFGDMAIWYTRGPDVLLLGFRDPTSALDLDRARRRFERADFRAGFARSSVGSFLQLLTHEILPLGAAAATEMDGPTHTLRHPILSDSAARAFFVGRAVDLPHMPSQPAQQAAAKRSLVLQQLAGSEASEDVFEEMARHACAMGRANECAALLARWTASHPDSQQLADAARQLRTPSLLAVPGSELSPAKISRLVELYHGRPVKAAETPGPVRDALATSNLYMSHFLHTFPFDRNAVVRAWTDCATDPRTAIVCADARRQAERQLGKIYPDKSANERSLSGSR